MIACLNVFLGQNHKFTKEELHCLSERVSVVRPKKKRDASNTRYELCLGDHNGFNLLWIDWLVSLVEYRIRAELLGMDDFQLSCLGYNQ